MLLHQLAGNTAAIGSRGTVRLTARLLGVPCCVERRVQESNCKRPAVACASSAVPCPASSHRVHRNRRPYICRSTTFTDPLPDDLQLELNPDTAAKEVTYDEDTKTVKIPLAAVNDGQRRTKMVMFTCNKCGGRSARLVNPVAWEKGAVFCQCQHCSVWHTLAAHPSILEEIRYNDPEWQLQQQDGSTAAAGGSSLQEDSQTSSETLLRVATGSDNSQDEVSSAPAAAAAAAANVLQD
eukprot:GHRQ01004279.1.p1 GENE.GHRQ01004279.1~~GHRQ01004279.1.p1  ORF type:complete len:238 (+),score=51.04 GHRQ01004279.1:115-828(+)